MSADTVDDHDNSGGATGIQWIEAGEAVKHPTMQRTAPQTKNYLAQGISGVKLKNPGSDG